MEAIRAERRENCCTSETSAQIALKMKFGKEKVVSKRKGKWYLYHPSERAKRFDRSEESVVTRKLVLRSSSDLYALGFSIMKPKATSWLVQNLKFVSWSYFSSFYSWYCLNDHDGTDLPKNVTRPNFQWFRDALPTRPFWNRPALSFAANLPWANDSVTLVNWDVRQQLANEVYQNNSKKGCPLLVWPSMKILWHSATVCWGAPALLFFHES